MKKLLYLFLCCIAAHAVRAEETSNVDYGQSTTMPTLDLIWQFDYVTYNSQTCAAITGVRNSGGPTVSGELAIPQSVVVTNTHGESVSYIVKAIAASALTNQVGITSVTIPQTIENIGDGVFAGCTILGEITVNSDNPWFTSIDGLLYTKNQQQLVACPATVEVVSLPSTLTRVRADAFAYCHRLTSVTLPATVTAIGQRAFQNCTLLESIIFLGNAPAADTTICMNPEDITIYKESGSTGWDVPPWTSFKKVRDRTSGPTSAIQSAEVGNITWHYRILDDGAEIYNNGVAAIPVGASQTYAYDAEKKTWVGDGTLTIPSALGGQPVTHIGVGAFRNCSALTGIVIPSTVTVIDDYAFKNCGSISEITLPNSLKELGVAPFAGTAIQSFNLPLNVHTLHGNPVAGCLNLTTITCDTLNRHFTATENVLYNRDKSRLYGIQTYVEDFTVPASVSWVASNAFSSCTLLKKITYLGNAPALDDNGINLYADVNANLISYAAAETTGWNGDPASTEMPISGKWPLVGPNQHQIISLYTPGGGGDPSEIHTSGDWRYRIVDGGVEIWNNGNTAYLPATAPTTITVPTTLDGYAVVKIGEGALANFAAVTAISIPIAVRAIEAASITNLPVLASFSVDAGNPYYASSSEGALYDKDYTALLRAPATLEAINIPSTVTSFAKNAFKDCSRMKELTFNAGAPYTADADPFVDCHAEFVSLVPYGVSSFGTVPGTWNNRPTSNWGTAPIADDGVHTSGDWRYRIVDGGVEIWNNGNTAYLPATAPTTITVPTTLDGLMVVKIGEGALANFSGVTAISIPTAVRAIEAASITNLPVFASFSVDAGNPYYASSSEGALYDKDYTALLRAPATLEAINIPSTVTRFAKNVFEGCFRLKKVTFAGNAPTAADGDDLYLDAHASLTNFVATSSTGFGAVPGTWHLRPVVNNDGTPEESQFKYRIVGGSYAEIYNAGEAAIDPLTVGAITVPEKLGGYLVKKIGAGAFKNCVNIESITLPSSINEIGDYAFYGCEALESIDLPNSLVTIGKLPFYGTSITSINLPNKVKTLNGNPVAGCEWLKTITVDKDNRYFIVNGGLLFNKKETLLIACQAFAEEITVPSTVAQIASDAFSCCYDLLAVNFEGNAPTCDDDLYIDCEDVTSYVREDATGFTTGTWKGRPIVVVGSSEILTDGTWYYTIDDDGYATIQNNGKCALVNPAGTTTLTIPSVIDGHVILGLGDFALCGVKGISTLTIPDTYGFIGSGVFSNCTALSNVKIGKGVITIGRNPCYGTAITSLEIPSGTTTINGNPGAGATLLREITVNEDNISFSSIDGLLYDLTCSTLLACPARKLAISIPATVTTISSGALAGCTTMLAVNYDGDAPTCDDDLYADCAIVTSYVGEDAAGFTTGSWKGRPIIINDGSDIYTDGTWYYTIDDDGYATIQNNGKCALVNPAGTTSISLPSEIDGHVVVALGDYALSGVKGITTSIIPSSYESLGDGVFSNCTSLASVTIGSGVRTIGRWPFYGTAITSLSIPDSVNSIDGNPGAGASMLSTFAAADTQPYFTVVDGLLYDNDVETLLGCPATKSEISLPATVTTIAEDAFYGCHLIAGGTDVKGDVAWHYETDGTSATVTAVEGATGIVTIPSTLSGLPVAGLDSSAFNGCTGITEFVSLSSAFTAKNKCLYSADGTILVRVPDTLIFPHTIKTTTEQFVETKTTVSEIETSPLHVYPSVITYTTNASPAAVSTQSVTGNATFQNILKDVVVIRNYAFFGCNLYPTVSTPTTFVSSDNQLPQVEYLSKTHTRSTTVVKNTYSGTTTEYKTKLILSDSVRKIEPNALTGSGITYDGELPYLTIDDYPYEIELAALNASSAIGLADEEFFPITSPDTTVVSDAQYRSYFALTANAVAGKPGYYNVSAELDATAIEFATSQLQMAAKISEIAAGTADRVTLSVKPGLYYAILSATEPAGTYQQVDKRFANGTELELLMTRPSSSNSGYYILKVSVK